MEELIRLLNNKIDSIDNKLDQVRTIDIPELKAEIKLIKEKSSSSARLNSGIYSGVGTLLATIIAYITARWNR